MSSSTAEMAMALYQAADKAGIGPELGEFLRRLDLACRQGDPAALAEFTAACSQAYQEAAGQGGQGLPARVVSAQPLDEQQQKDLTAALSQRFGQPVFCRFELDESLLGGAVTYIDGLVIDGSLKGRMESLKQQMTSLSRGED